MVIIALLVGILGIGFSIATVVLGNVALGVALLIFNVVVLGTNLMLAE